jgi:hypothetical protein
MLVRKSWWSELVVVGTCAEKSTKAGRRMGAGGRSEPQKKFGLAVQCKKARYNRGFVSAEWTL